MVVLVFGSLGLLILLRFYTNPIAREARLSRPIAIGIASVFFILALYLGTVGRAMFSNLSGLFIASTGALGYDIYSHFINVFYIKTGQCLVNIQNTTLFLWWG